MVKADDLKNMKKTVDTAREQADSLLEQAEMVTKLIPGDADDKLLSAIKTQVDSVTEKYDKLGDLLPGSDKSKSKKSK